MSYRSDGGGPAAPASGHCAVAAPQPSLHMAVAPATRRDSGGAEARAPIRRRRAHSHRPGLCSDNVGRKLPRLWSRGRRASPRQRGSSLGRRRSDVVPGPTKSVQPLTPPRRGASSRTCDRPQRPRNPPLQGRRASDPATTHRHSREGGNPPGGAGCHPLCATARADPASLPPHGCRASDPALPRATPTPSSPDATRRASTPSSPPCPSTRRSRPTSPHSVVSSAAPSAWPPGRCTPPCWRSCSVPPPGATPSSPICERHPLGQPAQQGTQTAVNQRRTIQQPRQGRPRQETIAVLPPGQLQKTTKNTKQSYKGRLIIRHFCSPRRPSSPTTCPATLPPQSRRAPAARTLGALAGLPGG